MAGLSSPASVAALPASDWLNVRREGLCGPFVGARGFLPIALRPSPAALNGVTPTLTGGDSIVMSGFGRFGGSGVKGGGEFVHFNGTQIPSPNFERTGRGKGARLISFT